jgi:hypothetical protein
MKLDLETLRERHPRLHPEHAADLGLHAAVALQGQGHAPGARLVARIAGVAKDATLSWKPRADDAHETLDPKRLMEFGAEAVALALAHEARRWSVVRRLPEGDSADWLLRDEGGALVALEVSGTDTGDAEVRMRAKLAQVAKNEDGKTLSACVVRFEEPAAWLEDATAVLR